MFGFPAPRRASIIAWCLPGVIVATLFISSSAESSAPIATAATPIATAPHSSDWRANIRAFAEAHLQHTAWGPAHGRRDYEMTLSLARAEGVVVDDDALYAAAYLHDMGGIPPYAKAGVDHGDRSIQLVDSVLVGVAGVNGKVMVSCGKRDQRVHVTSPITAQRGSNLK